MKKYKVLQVVGNNIISPLQNYYDGLQLGQDIELAIEMKRIKSCYNCENFNHEDDWCKLYNDYPPRNFYTENDCKLFEEVKG